LVFPVFAFIMATENLSTSNLVEDLYYNISDYEGFNDCLPHGFTDIRISTLADLSKVVEITPCRNVSRRDMLDQITSLSSDSQSVMKLPLCEDGRELRTKLFQGVDYVCPDDEARCTVNFLLALLEDCAARNPGKICTYGLNKPHAWCVKPDEIAFEKNENVRIEELIDTINKALLHEFECSRRESKHTYTSNTPVHIGIPNDCSEDSDWMHDLLCEITDH
jgi:hypothetical protein